MRPVRLCTMLLAFAMAAHGPAFAEARPPDGNLDLACNFLGACPPRVVPGGPDRDARPFTGRLGRPCGWRDRPTPEGVRRVRACW